MRAAGGSGGPSLATLIHAARESADQMSMDNLSELNNADTRQQNDLRSTPNASSPAFLMESNHPTVLSLWRERYVGVNDRPSIVAMVGKKLSKTESQRKLFARRKIIIDEIARLARDKVVPESEVVERLDGYRSRNKLSITKLRDEIKRKRASDESII